MALPPWSRAAQGRARAAYNRALSRSPDASARALPASYGALLGGPHEPAPPPPIEIVVWGDEQEMRWADDQPVAWG